jgi:hypothetical protein
MDNRDMRANSRHRCDPEGIPLSFPLWPQIPERGRAVPEEPRVPPAWEDVLWAVWNPWRKAHPAAREGLPGAWAEPLHPEAEEALPAAREELPEAWAEPLHPVAREALPAAREELPEAWAEPLHPVALVGLREGPPPAHPAGPAESCLSRPAPCPVRPGPSPSPGRLLPLQPGLASRRLSGAWRPSWPVWPHGIRESSASIAQ